MPETVVKIKIKNASLFMSAIGIAGKKIETNSEKD